MLGATLIQSKDEEDCSLRKAGNRLLLPSTLRNFFCLHPLPSEFSFFRIFLNQDRNDYDPDTPNVGRSERRRFPYYSCKVNTTVKEEINLNNT
jgi:hypothetical protein